jgi:hypothetical protein
LHRLHPHAQALVVVVNTSQMKPSASPGVWQQLIADAQQRGCFFQVTRCG